MNIKILSEHEYPPEEKERLPVVREAYENLDYEIGSKACMFRRGGAITHKIFQYGKVFPEPPGLSGGFLH